jgi:hypothetical protein
MRVSYSIPEVHELHTKLGTWVGAGAPRLNPAPALRTPILLRKLIESLALGLFGVHKQGVGTL